MIAPTYRAPKVIKLDQAIAADRRQGPLLCKAIALILRDHCSLFIELEFANVAYTQGVREAYVWLETLAQRDEVTAETLSLVKALVEEIERRADD